MYLLNELNVERGNDLFVLSEVRFLLSCLSLFNLLLLIEMEIIYGDYPLIACIQRVAADNTCRDEIMS